MENVLSSIYIHIPFCQKICPFCNFTVLKNQAEIHIQYVKNVCREIELWGGFYHRLPQNIKTLYFGGGTPSVLTAAHIKCIIQKIYSTFNISSGLEITLEMNPDNCTQDYLSQLISLGINRISVGIQSFQKDTLKKIGRTSTSLQCQHALENIQRSTIKNYNADIMIGIYQQSTEDIIQDMQTLKKFAPPHISIYILTLYRNTPLGKRKNWHFWNNSQEEKICDDYLLVKKILEQQNYQHYEVSNYALPQYESQQNLIYWTRKAYLGVGLGAHSFWNNERWENTNELSVYYEKLEKNEFPIMKKEVLTNENCLNEDIMISLRRNVGLDIKNICEKYSLPCSQVYNHLYRTFKKNLHMIIKNYNFSLTPRGILLADEFAVRFSEIIQQYKLT